MVADSGFQVWLDTQPSAYQTVMVPYIQSARDAQVTYRMDVIQNNGGSMARISQSGQVNARATQPTALTRVALSLHKGGECRIELVLNAGRKDAATYHFDCAPRS